MIAMTGSLPKPYHQEDACTIYHGDCAEIVPLLGRFDLLLTDPPYGIGADKNGKGRVVDHGWTYYGNDGWDSKTPDNTIIDACRSAGRCQIIWGGNYFPLPPTMGWLVWDKGQRDFTLSDGELAWTNRDKALRIFTYSRAAALQDGKQHPTQKPLALIKWCIEQAGDVTTILDPFAGSGTTGRAAKDLGKKAVLIEREERYCEIAANRLRQEVLAL